MRRPLGLICLGCVFAGPPVAAQPAGPLFPDHADIGTVLRPGSSTFDPASRAYSLAGTGENMWQARDAFHFAWTKASGDLALAADAAFVGAGVDPHRKACLLIRQSLDADSAYVDVALHGDGLTSLQFRATRGDLTHEVQANVVGPRRLKIEKRGKYVRMYLSSDDNMPTYAGASVPIAFEDPYYVGLGVCAHNKDAIETATFSRVELTSPLPAASATPTLYSSLETQSIASTDRRVAYLSPTRIEAPNWHPDGKSLIYNGGGRLYRVAASGGTPEAIDTGTATRCNNDHGVSPDGTMLAISDQSTADRQSRISILPIGGGTPRLVTPEGPSYWHGWSPDGKTLAYCARRGGEFDIYTIPAAGGPETRLTTAKGLDDGPEYSPDGKSIYFNSDRGGRMQVYRMDADGSNQQSVTADNLNNWFPHPSPDGRRLVYIAFDGDVVGHPENKDVTLNLLDLASKKVVPLARLFGGQGTANVPCWSPDGRRIAFVTYQLIP